MSRLSAVDSLFLGVETRELPAHVAGLQVFELPRGEGAAWLQAMMTELRRRPPGFPFNQRLKPGGIGLPELVTDDGFEIDYHLRHTVLPRPGNDEQLHAVLARMHANLVDRDRPLWEFYLIEGLAGRRFAFYIKIHHAICDGATFSKWMADATGTAASAPLRCIWERSHRHAGQTPRPWLEALQTPVASLRHSGDIALGLGKLAGRLVNARYLQHNERIALPLSGPHTALNAPLSASRSLAFADYPLEQLKAMGRPLGATLNDVVLALCDAALLRYLGEQGQHPDKPLVAAVPVNLRPPGESTAEGNYVTGLQVKLGQRDEGPAQRIQSIHQSVAAARALYSGLPNAASQAYSFSTALLGSVGMSLKLEGIMPPPLNLVISNVPGPRETRYFNGAKLVATYPISGIAPMTALNVTVYSYAGRLFFGMVSGRRAMPHLEDLKACLDEIYEEFRQALLA